MLHAIARRGAGILLALLLFCPGLNTGCRAQTAAVDPESLARGSVLVDSSGIHPETKGFINLAAEEAAGASSLFHIGSNSKAMTATMIAMLIDDGLLDWDTTVAEIWPQESAAFDPVMRETSLHQLLTHRSGVQAFTSGSEWQGLADNTGSPRERRRSFALYLLGRPPAGTPGEFLYSNAGYGIAAAMAEERSGLSWEELMRTRLFDALGMDVQFGWPLDRSDSEPTGYLGNAFGLRPFGRTEGYFLRPEIAPAGDLSMSIGDYGKFLQLHLDSLSGKPRLLSAESFAKLHAPVGDYACGWGVSERNGSPAYSHDGSAGTFYLRALISPAQGLATAAVVNAGSAQAADIVQELINERLAAAHPLD